MWMQFENSYQGLNRLEARPQFGKNGGNSLENRHSVTKFELIFWLEVFVHYPADVGVLLSRNGDSPLISR